MQKTLKIANMTCGHCKMKVEQVLNQLPGIREADVDLLEGTCDINADDRLNMDALETALSEAGYPVEST